MSLRFNTEMLILARESRGYTQKAFAERVGISQGELSKIETGLRAPSKEVVQKFAASLGYSPKLLYMAERYWGANTDCAYYRKRKSASLQNVRQGLAIANIRRIQISRLLISGAVELSLDKQFKRMDIEENPGGAIAIARTVRAMWCLPPGPVMDLTRTIEDAGGIVFRSGFGSTKIDALCQWVQGLPPMFFVNEDIPCDRMRWTLAHELGHIIMHHIPTENIEREANEFAAEFLMPAKEIKPYLSDLSLAKLASLKPHWKVSMNALLKRACDLATITERQRSYLWTQMGSLGYRTNEPIPLPQEEPALVKEILEVHQTQLGFSYRELAELMFMDEQEMKAEYAVPKTRLRLIV
jgi:Zn-dependent peptidase ImmA (M78 family)/transcriptional regulator with XRE-family HTH domain